MANKALKVSWLWSRHVLSPVSNGKLAGKLRVYDLSDSPSAEIACLYGCSEQIQVYTGTQNARSCIFQTAFNRPMQRSSCFIPMIPEDKQGLGNFHQRQIGVDIHAQVTHRVGIILQAVISRSADHGGVVSAEEKGRNVERQTGCITRRLCRIA
jgi:hypothetical protein